MTTGFASAQVSNFALMLIRGSDEWIAEMARSGGWSDPPFWLTPAYQRSSPWTPAETGSAFEVLKRIFSPKRTRSIFRRRLDPYLRHLLADPWAAWMSPLLGLGLDSATCGAWQRKSWVDLLVADGESCRGATFEIAVAAALVRAGIPTTHEPLKGKHPKNPDFGIDVGRKVLLEVKLSREGVRLREESDWLMKFSAVSDRTVGIEAHLELLEEFGRLQERDDGRWMRDNVDRLVGLVDEAKIRLASSSSYPATDVVESCIRVTVRAPRGTSGSTSVLGVPINSTREALRIVRNLLMDGATQVPEDRLGVILIDPGWGIEHEALVAEVQRWFQGDGACYPQVVGALMLSREYYANFTLALTRVSAAWRPEAPGDLRSSDAWDRLASGLSWHALRRFAFQTAAVQSTGS